MAYKDDFIGQVVSFYKNTISSVRDIELSRNVEGISHKHIVSYASYSPWVDDPEFQNLYELISGHTIVDLYRCYELYSWITKNKHIQGDILEVGVWKGGTGCLLAAALKKVSPEAKIFLVDTFKGVVKAGGNDSIYKGGEHSDTTINEVLLLISRMGLRNVQVIEGTYPDEVLIAGIEKLRFCHIDVDTYQSAKDVFMQVWPFITKGGCVIFDDYGFWGCEGVTTLCNELDLVDGVFIYNLNGHALLIKI